MKRALCISVFVTLALATIASAIPISINAVPEVFGPGGGLSVGGLNGGYKYGQYSVGVPTLGLGGPNYGFGFGPFGPGLGGVELLTTEEFYGRPARLIDGVLDFVRGLLFLL